MSGVRHFFSYLNEQVEEDEEEEEEGSEEEDEDEDTDVADELLDIFRGLLDSSWRKHDWQQAQSIIDGLEHFVKANSSLDRYRKLRIDEYMRAVGDFFYKCDERLRALEFYQRAVALSSSSSSRASVNLLAVESLENVINLFVERWHYRMLNDTVRNGAYARAIHNYVAQWQRGHGKHGKHGLSVFDIGTGEYIYISFHLYENIIL